MERGGPPATHPHEEQQARLVVRIADSVAKLTSVVDSVQNELKEVDSYSSDIVCIAELWSRYTHKLELAQEASSA